MNDRKKQLRGVLRLIEVSSFLFFTLSSTKTLRFYIYHIFKNVQENTSDFVTALKKILNRHPSFTKKVLGGCVRATQLAIDNLSKWSRASSRSRRRDKAEVRMSPRGLVLIVRRGISMSIGFETSC